MWYVELRTTTAPTEEWVLVRKPFGRPFRFQRREEAEDLMGELETVQPHVQYRLIFKPDNVRVVG